MAGPAAPDASVEGAAPPADAESHPAWLSRAKSTIEVEDASVLRGMNVAKGLAGSASVLSDRPATAEYFALSEPVTSISTFLSHNWTTPRWKKFLVLVLHYNLWPALMASFLVAGCSCCLTLYGWLPSARVSSVYIPSSDTYIRGMLCQPFGFVTFVIVLFGFHEVEKLLGLFSRARVVFLDKTCVHQCDSLLKEKGIRNLAGFLFHSQDILVFYSDVYFERLWTMYEAASWLMLHKGERMLVRPVFAPLMLLSQSLSFALLEPLVLLVAFSGLAGRIQSLASSFVTALFMVPSFTFSAWLLAKWTADRERLESNVSKFRLSEAKCASEDDRCVVLENMLALMKYVGLSDPNADDDEVFRDFEELVHKEVPKLMRSSFGRIGIPYQWALVIVLPHFLTSFDFLVVWILREGTPLYIALKFSKFLAVMLLIGPLLLAAAATVVRLRRLRSLTACFAIGVAGTGVVGASSVLLNILNRRAACSNLWLAILVLTYAVLTAATSLLYGPPPELCTRRRAARGARITGNAAWGVGESQGPG